MRRWSLVFALLLGAATALTGCDTPPTATRDEVMTAYQRGEFAKAYAAGNTLIDKSTGVSRDQVRFITGMSAYRTSRDADAIRLLTPLLNNQDKRIAGPANATLGLVYSERGEYERAAGLFRGAASLLEGESMAEANFYLGVTEQKIGHWPDARAHLLLAESRSTDAKLREAVRQRLSTTGFTLQFGAYNDGKNAEERAHLLKSVTARAGLGEPRVVAGSGGGKKLYLVQAGQFSTFEAATKAKQQVGRSDAVIAAVLGGK